MGTDEIDVRWKVFKLRSWDSGCKSECFYIIAKNWKQLVDYLGIDADSIRSIEELGFDAELADVEMEE